MTTALRLVFVAGLLGLLAWLVDPRALIARLQSAEPLPVLAALVLVQCQIVASAERWRLTATALGQPLSRGRAVTEYYVASLLNQLLPGGVSGDVVRVWRNRGDARNAQAWAVPASFGASLPRRGLSSHRPPATRSAAALPRLTEAAAPVSTNMINCSPLISTGILKAPPTRSAAKR